MFVRSSLPLAALVLLAAPLAMAQSRNTFNAAVMMGSTANGESGNTAAMGLPTGLNGFVGAAAISDMYEVEAGKLAEQRATDPAVKSFARKMVGAHTETSNQLKSTLAALNTNVTPPTALDNRRQGMIDDLRGAQGSEFDHRYMSQQVNAHKEALALMRTYARNGDTPAVKTLAGKTAPIVQFHLDMAEQLLNKHQT